MSQVFSLCKLKVKNKCLFYHSFFHINTMQKCYALYFAKEIFLFIATCTVLWFFFQNTKTLGLSTISVYLLIFSLIFLQEIGYSNTSVAFINDCLDIYRVSTSTYLNFYTQTIICHVLSDLCCRLTSIIPILIFSLLWRPFALVPLILGFFLGFLLKANEIMHALISHANSLLKILIGLLKSGLLFMVFAMLFIYGFNLMKVVLFVTKTLVVSPSYNESALLNKIVLSFITGIEDLKAICMMYAPFLLVYLCALIILANMYNHIRYKQLWESLEPKEKLLFSDSSLSQSCIHSANAPFIKLFLKSRLYTLLQQVIAMPEIVIGVVLECFMLTNIDSNSSRFLFIIWFYFLGNANYIRSLSIKASDATVNYQDNVDLYYFRLAPQQLLDMYECRIDTLNRYSLQISYFQSILSCVLGFTYISNWIYIFMLVVFVFIFKTRIHVFNCKLATFSSYFSFAKSCDSGLRSSEIDENQNVIDKLQNIFKQPFVLFPLFILILNYFFSFIDIFISLLILVLFLLIAFFLQKQMNHYIDKAGDLLEKTNVPD